MIRHRRKAYLKLHYVTWDDHTLFELCGVRIFGSQRHMFDQDRQKAAKASTVIKCADPISNAAAEAFRMRDNFPETSDSSAAQSRTLAIEVFESLRADILSSKLAPGTKLRFEDLRNAYGVGLSPLREALSRLAENRLVVAAGQRGFRVPAASVEDIMDVSMVRKKIEEQALRLSIENGDDAWEARVVASRHKLSLFERGAKNVTEDEWENRHREFHHALVSACGSPCLLHLHQLLTDQFDRYRRLSTKSRLPNLPRTLIHQRLVDAALSRNADLAVKYMQEHISEATELIVSGLSGGDKTRIVRSRQSKEKRKV